jgi:hypothetical protein
MLGYGGADPPELERISSHLLRGYAWVGRLDIGNELAGA